MPNPLYLTPWSPRLNWISWGRKPRKCDLPGLDVVVAGRSGNRRAWRCCLDGLFSN